MLIHSFRQEYEVGRFQNPFCMLEKWEGFLDTVRVFEIDKTKIDFFLLKHHFEKYLIVIITL